MKKWPCLQVTVPLKFLSLRTGLLPGVQCAGGPHTAPLPPAGADPGGEEALEARSITVSFAARRSGAAEVPLYVLHVLVRPRPFVVDQTFRYRLTP